MDDKKRRAQSFSTVDLLKVHVSKGRTPMRTYSKLQDRKLGPFQICYKARDNAYIVELPDHLHISPTFNIVDIHIYFSPYAGVSYVEDSRKSSIQKDN